jgi:hypothetical protein
MSARLQILGVYQLDVTPEVFAEQLPIYGDEEQCRYHFSSVLLIEAIGEAEDGRFSLDGITQPNPAYPHNSPQAAWDEGLLSSDGKTLLARKISCVKGTGFLRFAFYMHFWDPRLPLLWKYGEVTCPTPQPMPDGLRKLMPYRPCD